MTDLAPSEVKEDDVAKWVKYICNSIYYYAGLGDFWYEKQQRPLKKKIIYALWVTINVGSMMALVLSEIGTLGMKNLTTKERYDSVQYSFAHGLVIVKMMCILSAKKKIRPLLRKMLVDTRELFLDKELEKSQLRTAKVYCFAVYISMVICMLFVSIDGLVFYFKTGLPWRTLMTVYPTSDNISYKAYFWRGFISFLWYHLITCMTCSDFLTVTNLIYCAFKFRILAHYFRNLKTNFERDVKSKTMSECEQDMYRDFVKGIKLHKEVLWCARNIQNCFGNLYSFQVTQSIISFIGCLAQLVTTSRSYTNFLSTMTFMMCMLVLTACYMWSCGEITHEASLVSDAIFDCGWHLCSPRARMRKLCVVTIINCQVPVVMTAFGIVELSYENFLKIIKHSYSVFAVLY